MLYSDSLQVGQSGIWSLQNIQIALDPQPPIQWVWGFFLMNKVTKAWTWPLAVI